MGSLLRETLTTQSRESAPSLGNARSAFYEGVDSYGTQQSQSVYTEIVESSTICEGAEGGQDTTIAFTTSPSRASDQDMKRQGWTLADERLRSQRSRLDFKCSRIETPTSTHFDHPSRSPLFLTALSWRFHYYIKSTRLLATLFYENIKFLSSFHAQRKNLPTVTLDQEKTPVFVLGLSTQGGTRIWHEMARNVITWYDITIYDMIWYDIWRYDMTQHSELQDNASRTDTSTWTSWAQVHMECLGWNIPNAGERYFLWRSFVLEA